MHGLQVARVLGFWGVRVLGFEVLKFRVWALGFGFWSLGLGFGVLELKVRVEGFEALASWFLGRRRMFGRRQTKP